MKKILTSIAALGLVAMVFMPTYAAKPENTPNNGNSHEKATGSVYLEPANFNSSYINRYMEFNAHETDPAKGHIYWWMEHGTTGQTIEHWINVDTVKVEGPFAYFSGIAYKSTQPGQTGHRLFVKVHDGGTPGKGYDYMWQSWDTEIYDFEYEVSDGNLVVHYNQPWVIDTITVPSNGSVVSSTESLVDGMEYMLKVSGTYTYGVNWGFDENGDPYGIADAEFSNRPAWTYGPGWVDDLPVPWVGYLDLLVDGNDIEFGDFNDSHEYSTMFTGDGNPLDFNIIDSGYTDNSGNLTVEIYQMP